jgi:hypothetical protein
MPSKFHVFTQYWPGASDAVKHAILTNCQLANTSVHLFTEKDSDLDWRGERVQIIPVDRRITYSTLLSVMKDLDFPSTSYIILLNSDIAILPQSLERIPDFAPSTALAVSRREKDGSLPISAQGTRPENCQDVWIFRPHKPSSDLLRSCEHLELGRPGCENRFAAELYIDGYSVYNPCNDLMFEHTSPGDFASYPDPSDSKRYNGLYAYLFPCSTFDIERNDCRKYIQLYPKVRGRW